MSAQTALADLLKKVEVGLNRLVEEQANTAQQLVNTPYPPASSPGNPPHKRSGNLQVHIHALPAVLTQGGFIAGLGVPMDEVPYARRLELGFVGTDSKGRRYNQAPRPYLVPAAHIVAAQAGKFF